MRLLSTGKMDEKRVPTILRKKLPPFLEEIKNTPQSPKDINYAVHMYLQENDLRVKEEGSEIIDFLRGKNVLVTGGTGFLGKSHVKNNSNSNIPICLLGKLLVEKLLRCCKDIGTLYLIIRTKKGVNPQNRIKDFLDNFVITLFTFQAGVLIIVIFRFSINWLKFIQTLGRKLWGLVGTLRKTD